MFRAISPVVTVIPVKLLASVRIDLSGAPILFAWVQSAVLKPDSVSEERKLAGVVHICDENIARIANAVQVTICLLVSTSVY